MTKQLPCCARKQAKLVMDQANLARLARLASGRAAKGLSTAALEIKIAENKVVIDLDRVAIDDHAADHAGGGL